MSTPQISEERLKALNFGLFWLNTRKESMGQWLSFADWHEVNRRINSFAPHLLVTISRRIPRLLQALGLVFEGPADGVEPPSITDLAIPWSAGCLKKLAAAASRLKVALLDDSFSTGVTHGYVREQLMALLPRAEIEFKCFVIAMEDLEEARAEEKPGRAFKPFSREDVIAIRKLPPRGQEGGDVRRETYSDFTRLMPRALMMLPKPFEIEYPVIKLKYGAIRLAAESEPRLDEIFGGDNVHSLKTNFMENAGLARYSLDLASGSGFNRKIRLYFDDALRECRLMAHAPGSFIFTDAALRVMNDVLKDFPMEMEPFRKEAVARLNFFMSSLALGHLALKLFEDFLDIDDLAAPFSCQAARYMFGPEFKNYWRGLTLGDLRKEAEIAAKKKDPCFDGSLEATRRFLSFNDRKVEASPFWKIGLNEGRGELLAEVRDKLRNTDQDANFQYFTEFFYALADYAGNYSNGQSGICGRGLEIDGFPSEEEFERQPNLRQKVGPTFSDLLKIMKTLWDRGETAAPLSPERLHNKVSRYLDCCVDDGIVVPAISTGGDRIYRKGESDAHNRDIARFYQLFKRLIEPDRFFDLADRDSFRELSDEEASLMKRAIKNADKL